jgi:hypothetical protein
VSITGFSSLKDFLGRHDTAKTPAWRYDIKASTTGPIVAKIVVHSHGAISDAEAVYTETVGSCRADNRASSCVSKLQDQDGWLGTTALAVNAFF